MDKVKEVRKCSGNTLLAEYIYNAAGQRVVKKVYSEGVLKYTEITIKDLYDLRLNADGSSRGEVVKN